MKRCEKVASSNALMEKEIFERVFYFVYTRAYLTHRSLIFFTVGKSSDALENLHRKIAIDCLFEVILTV